jgi:hypothetical protein
LTFNGGGTDTRIDNVTINAALVPEPSTAFLMMAGLVGLAKFGRRRS